MDRITKENYLKQLLEYRQDKFIPAFAQDSINRVNRILVVIDIIKDNAEEFQLSEELKQYIAYMEEDSRDIRNMVTALVNYYDYHNRPKDT